MLANVHAVRCVPWDLMDGHDDEVQPAGARTLQFLLLRRFAVVDPDILCKATVVLNRLGRGRRTRRVDRFPQVRQTLRREGGHSHVGRPVSSFAKSVSRCRSIAKRSRRSPQRTHVTGLWQATLRSMPPRTAVQPSSATNGWQCVAALCNAKADAAEPLPPADATDTLPPADAAR